MLEIQVVKCVAADRDNWEKKKKKYRENEVRFFALVKKTKSVCQKLMALQQLPGSTLCKADSLSSGKSARW